MADADLFGGFPHSGARGGNNIVFVHNYHNVNVVSQGSNVQFTGAINEPTEVLLMQYFRGIPKEVDKLKIIAFAEEIFNAKEENNNNFRNTMPFSLIYLLFYRDRKKTEIKECQNVTGIRVNIAC